MPKKIPKALSKEVYEICEYADDRCLVCQLPLEILKEISKLRFKDGMVLRDIAKFLKARGYGKIWPTHADTHFTKHCRNITFNKLVPYNENVNPKLAEIVSKSVNDKTDIAVKTQRDIDNAYTQLTRLIGKFANNLPEIQNVIDNRFADKEQIERDLKKIPILFLMEQFAALQKQSREQIRDIAQMRAPKVMVAQFLESSINEIIRDVSDLLKDSLAQIQQAVIEDAFAHKDLNQTFVKVYQSIIVEYKGRMLSLKREAMARAVASLAEMEKVI